MVLFKSVLADRSTVFHETVPIPEYMYSTNRLEGLKKEVTKLHELG